MSASIEDVLDGEGIGILTATSVLSVRRDAGPFGDHQDGRGQQRELAYGEILAAAGGRPSPQA